jgi:hypothetical protein
MAFGLTLSKWRTWAGLKEQAAIIDATGVTLAGAQTLTNKTLTTPTIVDGVSAKTAAYTVTTADSGKCFTNLAATAAVTFSLPAATVGLKYRFYVLAAYELQIDPNGTETIGIAGTQQAAGKYVTADAVGEYVDIECLKAGQWEDVGTRGTWTAEG